MFEHVKHKEICITIKGCMSTLCGEKGLLCENIKCGVNPTGARTIDELIFEVLLIEGLLVEF